VSGKQWKIRGLGKELRLGKLDVEKWGKVR
jgi:hypothetical protein